MVPQRSIHRKEFQTEGGVLVCQHSLRTSAVLPDPAVKEPPKHINRRDAEAAEIRRGNYYTTKRSALYFLYFVETQKTKHKALSTKLVVCLTRSG